MSSVPDPSSGPAGEHESQPPAAVRPLDLGIGRLFDQIRDAAIVADVDSGRIVLWNPCATTLFGYSAAEARELAIEALMPERLRAEHRTGLARYRATGHGAAIDADVVLELVGLRRTGEEFPIEMTLSPIEDAAVAGHFVLAIVRDASERKRAEEERVQFARAQADEVFVRLKAMVESSDDAIIGKTLDGIIVGWNPGAERIYGYTADEVLGQPISILVPPDRPDELPGIMERLRRGEHIDHFETERIRKDGRRLTMSISISPITDASGRVTGASTIARDVTRRKRAEEALRFQAAASELLATSLDFATTLQSVARLAVTTLADWCTVDVLEEDGTIRNLAVAHMDPAKIALARELQRRAPVDPDAPYGVPHVLRTRRSELYAEIPDSLLAAAALDAEALRILRDLGLRSAMVVPLLARGHTLGAITFVAAESERRYGPADLALAEDLAHRAALAADNARLYRDAQEAIHVRDEFLSVAAHELKTPITSLRGFAQLTTRQLDRDGTLDPARLHRALEVIDQQAEKLARLVSQLLDVSRLEGGQVVLERTVTDVAELVRTAAAAAQANTSRHTVVVQTPAR